jgi:hypothetical protein
MKLTRARGAVSVLAVVAASPDERDGEGLAYQLGPERHPMQIDSEYLDIAIHDNRVVRLSLSQG